MQVQPYLSFEGRCEEAINFYKKAIGAEVQMMMRFKESPEPCPEGSQPPNIGDKIMHASLQFGSTIVMMSDGRCQGQANFHGFSLTLSVSNEAQAERAFAALSDGGKVNMPLTRTFFSPKFGMVNDRFGVAWTILVSQR